MNPSRRVKGTTGPAARNPFPAAWPVPKALPPLGQVGMLPAHAQRQNRPAQRHDHPAGRRHARSHGQRRGRRRCAGRRPDRAGTGTTHGDTARQGGRRVCPVRDDGQPVGHPLAHSARRRDPGRRQRTHLLLRGRRPGGTGRRAGEPARRHPRAIHRGATRGRAAAEGRPFRATEPGLHRKHPQPRRRQRLAASANRVNYGRCARIRPRATS